MQDNNQAPQNGGFKVTRTPLDLPLVSPSDAGNLANHFINLYLMNCRCVTAEEALQCLGVLGERADAVFNGLTEQLQPVAEHEHSHESAAPAEVKAVGNKPAEPQRRNNGRNRNRKVRG